MDSFAKNTPFTPWRSDKAARGFTVTELLVAIAIIAILALLLIVVNRNVRYQAVISQSVSNQRQIFLGGHMYANDNMGKLPDHDFRKLFPWRSYAVFWGDLDGPGPEKSFGKMLKGRYIDDPRVFHSPLLENEGHQYETFRKDYEDYFQGRPPGAVRAGYYYNPDRLRDPETGEYGGQFFSTHDIVDPSNTVMVMDILVDSRLTSVINPNTWYITMADGSSHKATSDEVYSALKTRSVGNNYRDFLQLLDILLHR